MPVNSINLSKTSGFNASPATSALTNADKSYLDQSACNNILYAVGGAQNDVI